MFWLFRQNCEMDTIKSPKNSVVYTNVIRFSSKLNDDVLAKLQDCVWCHAYPMIPFFEMSDQYQRTIIFNVIVGMDMPNANLL
jgi:hypothetical protein